MPKMWIQRMLKIYQKLVTICVMLLVAYFTLVNQSGNTAVLGIYWVDHNYEKYPQPACVMMAELEPGDDFVGSENYGGTLFICTAGERFKQFRVLNGGHRIECIWDGESIEIRNQGSQ